jgi:DNA-binding HxlR family transcriptional regulator
VDSDDPRHGPGPASRTSGPPGGLWTAEAGEVDWGRVDEILAVVSGRWALPLMRALNTGVSRQTVLLETINARRPANSQLSRQILIATMTRLQEAGMVRRQTVRGRPRETHYYLTPVGSEILVEISKLGNKDW